LQKRLLQKATKQTPYSASEDLDRREGTRIEKKNPATKHHQQNRMTETRGREHNITLRLGHRKRGHLHHQEITRIQGKGKARTQKEPAHTSDKERTPRDLKIKNGVALAQEAKTGIPPHFVRIPKCGRAKREKFAREKALDFRRWRGREIRDSVLERKRELNGGNWHLFRNPKLMTKCSGHSKVES